MGCVLSCSDGMSIETILSRHRTKMLPLDASLTQRIVVRRKHIWKDALHRFRSGVDYHKHLRILFMGESAVDDGG